MSAENIYLLVVAAIGVIGFILILTCGSGRRQTGSGLTPAEPENTTRSRKTTEFFVSAGMIDREGNEDTVVWRHQHKPQEQLLQEISDKMYNERMAEVEASLKTQDRIEAAEISRTLAEYLHEHRKQD